MNTVEAHDPRPANEQTISAQHGCSQALRQLVVNLRSGRCGRGNSLVIVCSPGIGADHALRQRVTNAESSPANLPRSRSLEGHGPSTEPQGRTADWMQFGDRTINI